MSNQIQKPRVFVSHSSVDKAFVKVLVGELEDAGLDVWFDAQELGIGDSIVDGVSVGLNDTDYIVVVLSKASVESNWVKAELNFGLMKQFSQGGVIVVPILREDCEVPVLLRDRIYADFTNNNFKASLKKLLELFGMERGIPLISKQYGDSLGLNNLSPKSISSCHIERTEKCVDFLKELSLGDLRRLIDDKLDYPHIRAVYFDVFHTDIADKGRNKDKLEYCIDLLLEVKRLQCLSILQEELCKSFAKRFKC